MNVAPTPDTVDTLPRNTNNRGKVWGPCTLNNWTLDELNFLKSYCENNCEDYRINQEIGENSTPHLQFCMKFKNARGFNALKKLFPRAHIEKSKNWSATKNYCEKSETQVAECIKPINIIRCKDPLEGKELRPFQHQILDLIEQEPDDRTINWVYDLKGSAGKTTLAKHLCLKYPNEILYLSGKASDMKYGVMNFIDAGHNIKAIMIDLTRSVENFVSYEGIESLKNGIYYNTKYECKMVIYDSPHIIIFANFEPEYEKLSEDRWNIITL